MPRLKHKDTITLVEVTASEYGNNKEVIAQYDVKATFLQNTAFIHTANQDILNADGIVYPDERNSVVRGLANRLEGMYVICALYGAEADASWYKITSVAVNRDHLLSNTIDNIQCLLKRTDPLPGVS